MNGIRLLLATTAFAALPASAFATTFENNWSFVDLGTGQTVGGVISGLVNGNDLSAEGLTITVTQSPYAIFLGTYSVDYGASAGYPGFQDTYSASNGVVTFANFLYTNEITEFLRLVTIPNGSGNWPDLVSYDTLDYVYNDQAGVKFTAVTPSVPEPATWAMLIAGFGFVGGAMRRRSGQQPRVRYDFA